MFMDLEGAEIILIARALELVRFINIVKEMITVNMEILVPLKKIQTDFVPIVINAEDLEVVVWIKNALE